MVTIRFNPKAITSEGQIVKKAKFVPDHSVIFYVQVYGFQYKYVRFILSGKTANEDDIVKDGDEIIILPEVGFDPVTWAFIVLAFKIITVIATLASITMAIVSAVSRPRKPSYNTSSNGIDNGSPTYGWDGIQNSADVAIPIPVIYGEHRVGGNIIGEYVNTDGDLNYLNMLLGLSEGEIDSISSIQINGNPVENFSGITTETKMGTAGQTPIANFQQVHDTRSVNVNLLSGVQQVYTTVGTTLNALEIHLLLGNGLYQQDSNTGVLSSWTATYKVEYKLHSAGSYTNLGNIDINAQSRTAVRRVYRIDGLTAGKYDIRITKQSADSDFYHTGDLLWDTVDEITNQDLAYANTALLAIKALATNQLSGSVPTVTSIVRGVKVSQPQVFNGMTEVDWEDYYYNADNSEYRLISDDTSLTWDGTSYVTKWCANPVWCLMDLLLNSRYGLGSYIDTTMISLASFVSMSQYCENKLPDGNGGYEKRFRLDIVLDASSKAIDVLFQIAASFRGLLFYSAGTIKLKIDKPDTAVQLFGMGNIQESTFVQTWLSLKQRYNIVEVQFLNKDKNYVQDLIDVVDQVAIDAGDTVRKTTVKVFSTSVSEAYRYGRFILWMNKYMKRSIQFKAGIDAVICEPGDVINVSHDVPAWGIGSGRVQTGSTTTVVNLQDSVLLESGKTYALMVQFADDTIQERTITTSPGTVSQVTVSSAFSSAPAAYDKYSIGQITIEVKPFRILNIQVDNQHNCDISAIEYNASVYDDSAPALPTNNYSALTLGIPYVTDLKLTSGIALLNDGTIQSTIDVWFAKPDSRSVYVMYKKSKIYLSDDNGSSWVFQGETSGSSFQINRGLIDGTTYKVAVVSVGGDDTVGQIVLSPQQSIVSVGKSAPPSNVPSFLVNQNRDRLFFGWGEVTDLDLSGYEIRYGDSWATGKVLATQVKHSTYTDINVSTGSSQKFFIKAIDTSGNYSTTETEAVVTIDSVPFQNIIQSYMEAAAWAGTTDSTTIVSSTLEISSAYLVGTYVTPVRDIGFLSTIRIGIQTTVVDASGDRRFNDDTVTQFDSDPDARFSGQEVSGAVSFEIKTSDDNITWSAWLPYQVGDYKCRYFQLRMTLTRQSSGQVIQCSVFNYFADLPDVDDYSQGALTVSNAGTGLAVTFGKTFHQVPSVAITILSGSGIYAAFSSAPDTTGFTVKLYNAAGTAQTGTFSYHAHGV